MRVLNVKRSDSDWGVAAVAHLLTSSEWMQNRQKHRVQRRRPEEETSGKDWLSLRCASRSFALKAEQRNGERREAEVQREPAREKEEEEKDRVKFPWTIPGVPTRLIKLWLLESLNYITQLELWFRYFSVCNESLSEGWQALGNVDLYYKAQYTEQKMNRQERVSKDAYGHSFATHIITIFHPNKHIEILSVQH